MHLAALLLLAGLAELPPAASTASPRAQNRGDFSFSVELPHPAAPVFIQGVATFSGAVLNRRVGEPALPLAELTLLLPPGSCAAGLRARLTGATERVLASAVDVLPAPPATTDGRIEWPTGRVLVDGRDTAVYGRDALFPRDLLVGVRTGRLREYALATIRYAPYRFNPRTRTLTRLEAGALVVTCPGDAADEASRRQRLPPGPSLASAERAVTRLARNAATVLPAYPPNHRPAATPTLRWSRRPGADTAEADAVRSTYLVVTTRAFQERSGALADFLAAKVSQGFDARVVTEAEWGGGAGDVAAERLRAYLRRSALADGVEYLLLIGDPHPETGDVPMKRTWPRNNADTFREHRDAPTDHFYAELSGDWDADADGAAGEEDDDVSRPGGPDAFSELFVGRIPLIGGDVEAVDAILRKSAAYAAERDTAWRRSALLAMAPSDQWTPAFHLGERVRELVTEPNGWSVHRVYPTLNPYSSFSPIAGVPLVETMPCTEDAMLQSWRERSFGLVLWWTHGTPRVASDVFSTAKVPLLADHNERSPSFIYQSSCHNSSPEVPDNLAHALLRRGAVTTVSATRASWYYTGQTDFAASDSAPGLGFAYSRHLVSGGLSAGEALALARAEAFSTDGLWMNFLVMNVYGDPSLRLVTISDDVPRLVCPAAVDLGRVRQRRDLRIRCTNGGGGALQLRSASSSDEALELELEPSLRSLVDGRLDPARFAAGTRQELTVTVESNGGAASIAVRFSVEPPFVASVARLFLAGAEFNRWSPASPAHELALVGDSTWELELDLERPLSDVEYKLAANGGWDDNWGGDEGPDATLQHRAAHNARVSLEPGPTVLRVTEGPALGSPVRVQWLRRAQAR